jgi:Zn-finger nucleic acid-binding protein
MKCPNCSNYEITTLSVGNISMDVCPDRENCGYGWWDSDWYQQGGLDG